jgi:hypothetical protein
MAFDTRTHKFANKASARLGAPIAAEDTMVVLEAGKGALFPLPDPDEDEIFILTAENVLTGEYEIMYCTERNTDMLSVERGQEGTSILAFALDPNVIVQNRVTAGTLEYLASVPAGGGGDVVPVVPPFQIAFGDPDENEPYVSSSAFTYDPNQGTLVVAGVTYATLSAFTFGDSPDFLSSTDAIKFPQQETYEAMLLTADIVAVADPSGNTASFSIRAAFRRNSPGETIEVVGTPVEEKFSSGGDTWLVEFVPDFADDSKVKIQVTGSTGKNIRWKAQVKFNISGVTVS